MSRSPFEEPEYSKQSVYWTPLRRELRAWFRKEAPSLGELYEGALAMVFRENFPGRVRFVSHAVREIRNRLPDVIAGPKAEGQFQYKNRLNEILDVWGRHGLPLDGSLPPTEVTLSETLPDRNKIPIPRKVYKKIAKLVSDYERVREKRYETARRLFQAIDPNNSLSEETLRPRIIFWLESTEWFVKRAHERGATDAHMGADELKERFEIFEYALSGIVRGFFKTVEELDALLEEANA
ncbi:MAG TPA: hypothetical protein ENJ54_00670 [Chloroflexi bacterium]|nr:hypothetical protein [Chloroflexota bacterium]